MLGIIAQEAQAAHPLATEADPDGMLRVHAASIDAILLGAIHELAAKVEALEVVGKLKGRRRVE
jgi:hypothetical protein